MFRFSNHVPISDRSLISCSKWWSHRVWSYHFFNGKTTILCTLIHSHRYFVNPLMPTGAFNICCPRDCVSRHNGGTSGAPLKPLRDDSALRALSSLRGLRGQSLGHQILDRWAKIGLLSWGSHYQNPIIPSQVPIIKTFYMKKKIPYIFIYNCNW